MNRICSAVSFLGLGSRRRSLALLARGGGRMLYVLMGLLDREPRGGGALDPRAISGHVATSA